MFFLKNIFYLCNRILIYLKMEELFDFFYRELRKTDLTFQRYLIDEISWEGRLSHRKLLILPKI
jgi:hypothetical protein